MWNKFECSIVSSVKLWDEIGGVFVLSYCFSSAEADEEVALGVEEGNGWWETVEHCCLLCKLGGLSGEERCGDGGNLVLLGNPTFTA